MSSFFSKFRTTKPSKKKGGYNQGNQNSNGVYASSNNSSQASLGTRSLASSNYTPEAQRGRGGNAGFAPRQMASSASLNQSMVRGSNSNLSGAQGNAYGDSHTSLSNAGSSSGTSAMSSSKYGTQPLFLRPPFVLSALVKGRFQTIVELPRYVDQNEWMALNLFEFYGNVSQFVNMLSDYIDQSHVMNAGPGFDYLWIDTSKQAVRLPATRYIEYTLSWISEKFDDPTLFPTRQGVPFPPNFAAVLKSIYIQLFRIFAYIFHNQYDKIVHLSLEAHFNSLFCHFASFGKTFNLLDRNEVAPLYPLIQSLESQGKVV